MAETPQDLNAALEMNARLAANLARQQASGGLDFLKDLPAAVAKAVREGMVTQWVAQQQRDDHLQSALELFENIARGGFNQQNVEQSTLRFLQSRDMPDWTANQLPTPPPASQATPPALPWEMLERDVAGQPLLDPDFAGKVSPPPLPSSFYQTAPLLDPSLPAPPSTPEEKRLQEWEDAQDEADVGPPKKWWDAISASDVLPGPPEAPRSTKEEFDASQLPRFKVKGMSDFGIPRIDGDFGSKLPLGTIPAEEAGPRPPSLFDYAAQPLPRPPAEPYSLEESVAPRDSKRLNLNRADLEELFQLPGGRESQLPEPPLPSADQQLPGRGRDDAEQVERDEGAEEDTEFLKEMAGVLKEILGTLKEGEKGGGAASSMRKKFSHGEGAYAKEDREKRELSPTAPESIRGARGSSVV